MYSVSIVDSSSGNNKKLSNAKTLFKLETLRYKNVPNAIIVGAFTFGNVNFPRGGRSEGGVT